MTEKLQWDVYIPIFKNRFILKDLGLAIGIPFGLLIVFLLIVSDGQDAVYALGMLALLFVLTAVFVTLVYGGKYAPGFILDRDGITNYTHPQQAGRNKIINSMLIALGLLSGQPTAAGIGLLAQSRQVTRLKWSRVRKVDYHPDQYAILVRGGFAEKIVIFCTPENYAEAAALVKERVKA